MEHYDGALRRSKEDISVIIFSGLSGSPCLRNGDEVSPIMDMMVREKHTYKANAGWKAHWVQD